MTTVFRTVAAVALILSLGMSAQADARPHRSGAVPPSRSHTVMGLRVPR